MSTRLTLVVRGVPAHITATHEPVVQGGIYFGTVYTFESTSIAGDFILRDAAAQMLADAPPLQVSCCSPALPSSLPCDSCGTLTPIELIDCKPEDSSDPSGSDWTVHQCQRCYGPDFATCDGAVQAVRGWRRPFVAAAAWCRRAWFASRRDA